MWKGGRGTCRQMTGAAEAGVPQGTVHGAVYALMGERQTLGSWDVIRSGRDNEERTQRLVGVGSCPHHRTDVHPSEGKR